MNRKKFFQIAFGLLISCAFIWLILTSIPIDELLSTLSKVRADYVAAGVAFFVVGYLCRIARWQLMLRIDNPTLPFYRAGIPFMISIAANNVLPLRAGDVMRAFVFSKWLSVPSSSVLATLVSERLLDLLSLLVCLALALAYLGLAMDSATTLLGIGSAGLFSVAAIVALILGFPQVFQPLVMFLVRWIASLTGAAGEGLLRAVENLFQALRKMTRSGRTLGPDRDVGLGVVCGSNGVFLRSTCGAGDHRPTGRVACYAGRNTVYALAVLSRLSGNVPLFCNRSDPTSWQHLSRGGCICSRGASCFVGVCNGYRRDLLCDLDFVWD